MSINLGFLGAILLAGAVVVMAVELSGQAQFAPEAPQQVNASSHNNPVLLAQAQAAPPVAAAAGPSAPTAEPAAAPAGGKAGYPGDTGDIKLGQNVSLEGHRLLPPDNPWNKDISKEPVDPNSDVLVASIGPQKNLHPDFGSKWGIPYSVVDAKQPRVPVQLEYKDESDPGPYPVPPNAQIEGGPTATGDRHVLVIDRDNWVLYELYLAYPLNGGKNWKAGSGAIFDLKSNKLRPAGWTSADAAGLPVMPGLVRYDEACAAKEITHAVRFTCVKTRRAYVPPATHWASNSKDPKRPPMGMRVRLKADVDISKFPAPVQVILAGLKKYGMILADNGSDWFITGAPDARWDDEALSTIKKVKGKDFEVVKMDGLVADR